MMDIWTGSGIDVSFYHPRVSSMGTWIGQTEKSHDTQTSQGGIPVYLHLVFVSWSNHIEYIFVDWVCPRGTHYPTSILDCLIGSSKSITLHHQVRTTRWCPPSSKLVFKKNMSSKATVNPHANPTVNLSATHHPSPPSNPSRDCHGPCVSVRPRDHGPGKNAQPMRCWFRKWRGTWDEHSLLNGVSDLNEHSWIIIIIYSSSWLIMVHHGSAWILCGQNPMWRTNVVVWSGDPPGIQGIPWSLAIPWVFASVFMGVSRVMGGTKKKCLVYFMENPTKMDDDWGVPCWKPPGESHGSWSSPPLQLSHGATGAVPIRWKQRSWCPEHV